MILVALRRALKPGKFKPCVSKAGYCLVDPVAERRTSPERMPSSAQFRQRAVDCMRRARWTADERERLALLEEAARWMRAAVKPIDLSSDDVSPDPKSKT